MKTSLRKKLSLWLRRLSLRLSTPDGPMPPDRYRLFVEAVDARATREEWTRFSAQLAAQAYRDGYVAGVAYATDQTRVWPKQEMPVPPEPAYRIVPPQHPLASVPPHLVPEMINRIALLTGSGVTSVVVPEVRHGKR